jgi:hypothetical protein
MGTAGRKKAWRSAAAASISAVGAAILPKCPVCVAALAASVGISLPITGPVLPIASLLLLSIPLGFLAMAAMASRRFGPLVAGCAASLAVLTVRFAGFPAGWMAVGAVGLNAAVIWQTLRNRPVCARRCPAADYKGA